MLNEKGLSEKGIVARVMQLSGTSNTHSHSHHQIVFGLKGYAEFDISGSSGFVQKGVACIVPSNFSHSFFGDNDNKILILDITENLSLLGLEINLSNNALSNILDSPKYFQVDQQMMLLLKNLSQELEILANPVSEEVIGRCILHSLYNRLISEIDIEEVGSIRSLKSMSVFHPINMSLMSASRRPAI